MGMYRGYYFEGKEIPKEESVIKVDKSKKEILRPIYKDNIEFGIYRPIKVEVGYVINEKDDITFTNPLRLLKDSNNTRAVYSRKFYQKKWGSFYSFVPGNLSDIREVTSSPNLNEEYCVYGFLNNEDELIYYDHYARKADMYKKVFEGEFRVEDGKRILQCHSKGNKDFSPFFCYVTAFGKRDSIENHYQCAKRYENNLVPSSWGDVKNWEKQKLRQISWQIGKLNLPIKSNEQGNSFVIEDYGIQYYIMLWYKHLKENPQKLDYAKDFDDFEDPFAGYFPFCQAEVIKVAVREGLDALVTYFSGLRKLLSK